jgi:hypothetical protein
VTGSRSRAIADPGDDGLAALLARHTRTDPPGHTLAEDLERFPADLSDPFE